MSDNLSATSPKWERGRWIDSQTKQEYQLTVRALEIRGEHLCVETQVDEDPTDSFTLGPAHTLVFGNAKTYKNNEKAEWISIIGKPSQRTQELDFSIRALEARSAWLDIAQDIGDKEDTDGQRADLQRRLAGHVPTASIGFASAADTHTTDLWFCELYVPADTMERLLTAIRERRVDKIRVRMRFANLYVDNKYAGISETMNWFLPPRGKSVAEIAQGFVESVAWTETSVAGTGNSHIPPLPDGQEGGTDVAQTSLADTATSQAIDQLRSEITTIFGQIGSATKFWLVPLAVLLLVGLLFRR